MASKPRERVLKQAPSSPMNWRPRTAEDLIGQAKRVALAQASKAKRLSSDPSATMKLLLYGPPGVGKTSVVELVALQLAGTPLSIEDYNGREVDWRAVRRLYRRTGSIKQTAARFELSVNSVKARIRREGWTHE